VVKGAVNYGLLLLVQQSDDPAFRFNVTLHLPVGVPEKANDEALFLHTWYRNLKP
jgi:hypothetical protein